MHDKQTAIAGLHAASVGWAKKRWERGALRSEGIFRRSRACFSQCDRLVPARLGAHLPKSPRDPVNDFRHVALRVCDVMPRCKRRVHSLPSETGTAAPPPLHGGRAIMTVVPEALIAAEASPLKGSQESLLARRRRPFKQRRRPSNATAPTPTTAVPGSRGTATFCGKFLDSAEMSDFRRHDKGFCRFRFGLDSRGEP
jgi:hypothetical protein